MILLPCFSQAQEAPQSLNDYVKKGKTIVVAKCLKTWPMKANLEHDAEVKILHVIKGAETKRKISVTSSVYMREGQIYLIRSENEAHPQKKYFYINSRAPLVPLSPVIEIEKLKTLPIDVQVLRILSRRKEDVEQEIGILTFEQEALRKAISE